MKYPNETNITRRHLLKCMTGALGTVGLMSVSASGIGAESSEDIGLLLGPIRKKNDLPALAAAVIIKGKTAGHAAVGFRRYGSETHVTSEDQFHLGSCTKAMTATLCGMLIEKGDLSWDTTLAQAFPEMAKEMPAANKKITLDHLLAHRSGFLSQMPPEGKTLFDLHRLPGTPMQQREAYARSILMEEPKAEPGMRYIYSNRNFAIAGIMVERAAKMACEEFIAQTLFQPLGMKSAGFGAMGTFGRLDQPWQHKLLGTTHRSIGPGPHNDNPVALAPAGLVHCSIGDWAKFVELQLQGEQGLNGILKAETIKRLHLPQFGGDYAGGWIAARRSWADGRVLTHNGTNTMNFAVVWMAPQKNFAVLVATNQGGDLAGKACDEAAGMLIHKYVSR